MGDDTQALSLKYPATQEWHASINRHSSAETFKEMSFMYEAKKMATEVPRMAVLLKMEREGNLSKVHRQCSHSLEVSIENNHLSCAMGVKCSECPHLLSLDETKRSTPEEIDMMKAWTCAAHIVSKGGDVANEGYLLTVSDRMYWDNVYESMMSGIDNP